MKKERLSMILLPLIALTTLAGCGGGGGGGYDPNNFLLNGTDDNPYRIVTNPVTIKVFAPHSPGQPEYKDLKMFKKLSEVTGLQFEFTTPESGAYATQRSTIWERKDRPDLFLYSNPIAEQVEFAEKGYDVFVPYNDPTYVSKKTKVEIGHLINNYMPTYKKLLDENFGIPKEQEDAVKICTLKDGKMYTAVSAKDVGRDLTFKMFINNAWIKNVHNRYKDSFCAKNGIDDASKIGTIEQWVNVLKDFKTYDANNNGSATDEVPLTSYGMEYLRNYILEAYGKVYEYMEISNDGSHFEFTPLTDAYRQYLKLANTLYSEGIMDANTFSNKSTNDFAGLGVQGCLGAFVAAAPYLVTGQKNDKFLKDENGNFYRLDKEYTTTQPLLSSFYQGPRIQRNFGFFNPNGACIYAESNYIREIARLLDIMYSDLGVQLLAYGEENVDWTWDNPEKTSWTFNVPQSWYDSGKSQEDYRATITPNVGSGAGLYWANYFVGKMNDDVITDLNRQSEIYTPYLKTPEPQEYKFNEQEYEKIALIASQVLVNFGYLESQFIKGEKDPNSDADWEAYKKSMNGFASTSDGETYEHIYNTMLARYK